MSPLILCSLFFIAVFGKYNDGLNACEFIVSLGVNETRGLDLTPLANTTIIMQEESPNDAYYLKYTPCQNGVEETCYSSGKSMCAQMTGPSDSGGNGILALWDNKKTQPKFTKSSTGADQFTFEYPQMPVTCNDGCYNGRQQEINFICDPNADPYDKSQSRFYETPKTNGTFIIIFQRIIDNESKKNIEYALLCSYHHFEMELIYTLKYIHYVHRYLLLSFGFIYKICLSCIIRTN